MEKNEKSQDSRENRQKYRKKFRQNGAQGEREGQNRQPALCFASFQARPHLCTGNGSRMGGDIKGLQTAVPTSGQLWLRAQSEGKEEVGRRKADVSICSDSFW